MKYFVTSKISENIHMTPEGFMLCLGVPIARTGDMEYHESEIPLTPDSSGKVTITRDEKDVFDPKTIASFEGKPVTITHPEEFVDPGNWKELAVGTMQNVRRGAGEFSDSLIADLLVADKDAINLIKTGLREVSCGYEAEYEQTEDGKGVQTKIIGNHLALVDQGRAGSAYAIKDHKGKVNMSKKKESKWALFFKKFTDEAAKLADEEGAEEAPKEKDKEKSKDEEMKSLDAIKKMCADLNKMVASMGEPTVMDEDGQEPEPKEKKAKDADEESSLESRLKALEAAVSKLLEREAKEDEVPVDDDAEEMEDEDAEEMGDDAEEMEDEESSMLVGDTASRVEILAPGLKATKDAKKEALKKAYATKDGKRVIDALSGKKPDFESKASVEHLFIAASEVLKAQRSGELSRTKMGDFTDSFDSGDHVMTAEKLNQINAKFYSKNN